MKKILLILMVISVLLLAGCKSAVQEDTGSVGIMESEDETQDFLEAEAELKEALEDAGFEEDKEQKTYHFMPGAVMSDAVEKSYTKNGHAYNSKETFSEVTEQDLNRRGAVDYTLELYSMEDKDIIEMGAYNDWSTININDLNDWNLPLGNLMYEDNIKQAKQNFEATDEYSDIFRFDYNGNTWKCTNTGYYETKGNYIEVRCETLFEDRVKVSLTARSVDSEAEEVSVDEEGIKAVAKTVMDLIDFEKIASMVAPYSNWNLEEYPL